MSGQPLDHWLATLPGSVSSMNMRLDGTWKVNLTPKDRDIRTILIYSTPYKTREKAMAQVERWAHFHWRTVPPPEVAAAGHDRCIISIKPEHVDAWLNPDPYNLETLYAILDDRPRPYYEHRIDRAA